VSTEATEATEAPADGKGATVNGPAGGPASREGWLFGVAPAARARRLLLLLLIPALAHAATLGFDFVFDDNLVVLEDPLIVGPLDLQAVFRSEVRVANVSLGYYRPLITLSYRADRALWGLNPAGYHLSNLLWHLLATLLVYLVASRTTGRPMAAWIAAALFALLPAHAEAVGWIQGRVDLVSGSLVLGALLALLHAREAGRRAAPGFSALAGLAFLLALLAKESAAVFPLAWMAWEATPQRAGSPRDRWRSLLIRMAPLLLAGLLYLTLRRWAVGSLVGFPLSFSPIALRGLAVLSLLGEYGRILLAPDISLNFHRALWVTPTPGVVAAACLVALLLGGGLLALWRWRRPLFPWAAWVPILLLPPLLFALYAPAPERGFFTAERFLYLPSVGWCVLLGALIHLVIERQAPHAGPTWGWVSCGALLVGYAALTALRLQPWAEATEFYRAMQTQSGLSPATRSLVHNNLGRLYLERGESRPAQEEFQAALRIRPDQVSTLNNLGVLLIREGRPAEARPWLETAIRLNPAHAEAYGNLGAALEAEGDLPAARQAYEAGLRVAPGSTWLLQGLARTAPATDQRRITRFPRVSP
jgi:protein O-mannosyl-transferase